MKSINKAWLFSILILTFLLFNYPFTGIVNNKMFGAIPLTYVYFYIIWLVLIIVLKIILSKFYK